MRKIHLLLGGLLLLSFVSSCGNKEEVNLITTRNDLAIAINHAENGDTIYVGDIDFRDEPQLHKIITRITLSKSLTFKSGLKGKKATFTSGSFIIEGTKVAGENINVSFSDIIFDGDIDGSSLKDSDWDYADPDDLEPRMCQYAMLYKGNVSASYSNCDFSNYMSENGGALWALYGDYPGNETILLNYGDNSLCKLKIDINECSFNNNYAYYGGGALYFEGNKQNVDITVKKTTFEGNKTSCMEFAQGGGACFFNDLNSSFTDCKFISNNGSYSYGLTQKDKVDISEVPPEFVDDYLASISDQTSGGAICTKLGTCEVINSLIDGNNASLGGGIASYNSKVLVDGCVIKNNTAYCDLLVDSTKSTGPWSSMGLGGAVYINSSDGIENSFWNTSFYSNNARNGYGGIYSFYNGPNDGGILVYPEVNVNFCSFKDNTETISYTKEGKEWSARPGNGYAIPHIQYKGCFISDELCVNSFDKYEVPTSDNNYCYYTDNAHLVSDNVSVMFNDLGHIKLTSNSQISLKIPTDFSKLVSNNHYINNEPKNYSLGSNYSPNLFKETKKNNNSNVPLIVGISVGISIVLIATGVITFFLLKRKKSVNNIEEPTPSNLSIDDIISKIEQEVKITAREKDVLKLLLQGKKRAEIANDLFLSESAIKKYTTSIYSKIGVHSKLELIMKYQTK